jgi:hypothetical protein
MSIVEARWTMRRYNNCGTEERAVSQADGRCCVADFGDMEVGERFLEF